MHQSTKEFLSTSFDMKDLKLANVILGIKILKQNGTYTLTQSHYIEKLLQKFNHLDSLPILAPCDPIVKLTYNK